MENEELKIIEYTYFVTYTFTDKDLNWGADNTQVIMYKQIDGIDDIRSVENSIQNELGENITQVIVTNFILLRTGKVNVKTKKD